MINAPKQEQLLISANHCLAQFSKLETQVLWGVLFNYEARCGASRPMDASYQLLQVIANSKRTHPASFCR